MGNDWYVKTRNGEYGPVSLEQLKKLATDGRLSPNASLREGPTGDWIAGSQARGLFNQAPQAETESVATGRDNGRTHRDRSARRRPSAVLVSAMAAGVALICALALLLAPRKPPEASTASSHSVAMAPDHAVNTAASPNDAELARIRQENGELKARLAQLEAIVKPSQPSSGRNAPQGASIAPAGGAQEFESPEAVVRAYIGAATWQDRVLFVAQPDAVRAAMQRSYARATLTGPVISQMKPEVWSRAKILPSKQHPDGTCTVQVDMTGLDEVALWEYAVVSTRNGYKVDWPASQELMSKRERERTVEKWRLKDARIEVEVLSISQAGHAAKMSITVRNKSGAFISYWEIGASVFGGSKQFLASDSVNGSNLSPGESNSKVAYFTDVEAAAISSRQLRLKEVGVENEAGERLSDVQKYFSLSETN